MEKNILFTTIGVCILLTIYGCGGSTDNLDSENSEQPPSVSMNIGPEGGTIEVTNQQSLVYGVRLEIPQGALSEQKNITITAIEKSDHLPSNFIIVGETLTLSPSGLLFADPVIVTLPYDDSNNDGIIDGTSISEDNVGVMFTDVAKEEFEIFEIVARNKEENTVTIKTNHFSTYLSYVDATSNVDSGGSGTSGSTRLPGEHFVANPKFAYDTEGNTVMIPEDKPYYYITTFDWEGLGLSAKIDSYLSRTLTGTECTVAEDFQSCSFDASVIFPKVLDSGNAALWDWTCEFVVEHTYLKNYTVLDNAVTPDSGGEGIYCMVSTVDTENIQITWGINASQEIYYITNDNSPGHMLAIRFWATYQQ